MRDNTDLLGAVRRANEEVAVDAAIAARAEAVDAGIRRRAEMQAEREDDGGSPDAA